MRTHSECLAAPRKAAGWYYLRVRRFRRAAVTTCPEGHAASCGEIPPGTVPALRDPVRLWDMLRWATIEICHGRNPNPTCFVTPSYSGGASRAHVDGRLRTPQCFGTHHEHWAQPHGTWQTVTGDAGHLRPVLELKIGGGWLMAAAEAIP